MAKFTKTFRAWATSAGRKTRGKALVDTGADRTVLTKEVACSAGFDPRTARPELARAAGDKTYPGWTFPVQLAVGGKRAVVEAFVSDKLHGNIIGHDFLQATRAKVSYAQHPPRLEGLSPAAGPRMTFKPVTDVKMIARMRRASWCRPSRRVRRRRR